MLTLIVTADKALAAKRTYCGSKQPQSTYPADVYRMDHLTPAISSCCIRFQLEFSNRVNLLIKLDRCHGQWHALSQELPRAMGAATSHGLKSGYLSKAISKDVRLFIPSLVTSLWRYHQAPLIPCTCTTAPTSFLSRVSPV